MARTPVPTPRTSSGQTVIATLRASFDASAGSAQAAGTATVNYEADAVPTKGIGSWAVTDDNGNHWVVTVASNGYTTLVLNGTVVTTMQGYWQPVSGRWAYIPRSITAYGHTARFALVSTRPGGGGATPKSTLPPRMVTPQLYQGPCRPLLGFVNLYFYTMFGAFTCGTGQFGACFTSVLGYINTISDFVDDCSQPKL